MGAEWYLKVADKEVGPLTAQQLKAMADRGQISPGDPVRLASSGWVPAGNVKGLLTPGESLPEPSSSGRIPVAKRLEEPPPEPAAKRRSRGLPTAPRGATPSAPVVLASPVARLASDRADDGPPAAPGPPIPGFAIGPDQGDASAGRLGRRAGGRAGLTRRRREMIVAACVVAVVALGVAGGLLLVSGRGPATTSETRARSAHAPKKNAAVREEVFIPGLAEYLGETEGSGANGATGPEPKAPAVERWTDASAEAAECGALRVRIASAEIGRPRLRGKSSNVAARPASDCLLLRLELYNTDKAKKLDYRSWNVQSAGVILVDDQQNRYAIKPFAARGLEPDGQIEGGAASLDPEETTRDLLVFEKPAEGARSLRLELPAAAFGQQGSLKFEIPASMIAVANRAEDDAESFAAHVDVQGPSNGAQPSLRPGTAQVGEQPRAPKNAGQSQQEPEAERDGRSPIPIPGVTDQRSQEGQNVSDFTQDPKLMEARDGLLRQPHEANRAARGRRGKKQD